jgi:glycosyltransferase involved in cell wall biosynthesis
MLKTKIALVHDYLCNKAGSERVFQYMCEAFPEADVYTLAYNPSKTFPYFESRRVRTTWLNSWVQSSSMFNWLFPIATHVMEHLDLSGYDLIISSSATTAKYLNARNAFHICYCYIPTRALWHFEEYFGQGLKTEMVKLFLPYLKKRDWKAAQKVGTFLTLSKKSQAYIQEYYGRDADILPCPIDTDKFVPASTSERSSHYLIISRLERWKKIDYAIEAFNQLGLPLKVIGAGSDFNRLQALAKDNISFLGEVNDDALVQAYQECKAIIFTPFLEYGLIPLEANASGTPVIGYGYGGIEETMTEKTALFFYEQTPQALIAAVQKFEKMEFDSQHLREHALKWSIPAFKARFREQVLEKL